MGYAKHTGGEPKVSTTKQTRGTEEALTKLLLFFSYV